MTDSQRKVFDTLDIEEKVLLCMYTYSQGIDFCENSEYENLKEQLPAGHVLKYLNWENTDYSNIQEIIKLFNFNIETDYSQSQSDNLVTEEIHNLIQRFDESKSISMVDTLAEAEELFLQQAKQYPDTRFEIDYTGIASFKHDGWHMRAIFGTQGLIAAVTRGRNGAAYTISTHMYKAAGFPIIKTDVGYCMVRGELVQKKSSLTRLRAETGKKFKNVRNSITSFIHETVDVEKYKDAIDFRTYSLQYLDNPNEELICQWQVFSILEDYGFNVAPYELFNLYDYSSFRKAFFKLQDLYINEFEEEYECDGVVIQPNEFSIARELNPVIQSDNNANGMCAVKAEYWKRIDFYGKVVRIEIPPAPYSNAIIAIVEPIDSKMTSITRVPLINLQTALYKYGRSVDIGDIIHFTYHSNQIVKFEGFA